MTQVSSVSSSRSTTTLPQNLSDFSEEVVNQVEFLEAKIGKHLNTDQILEIDWALRKSDAFQRLCPEERQRVSELYKQVVDYVMIRQYGHRVFVCRSGGFAKFAWEFLKWLTLAIVESIIVDGVKDGMKGKKKDEE